MIWSISTRYFRCFSNKKTYYDVLNIGHNSTSSEIKLAYYKLSKQYHPDLNKDIDTTIFRELNQAYEVLGNPESRYAYDRSIGLITDPKITKEETEENPTTFYRERQAKVKAKRYYTHTISNLYYEPKRNKESERLKILKQRRDFDRAFILILIISLSPITFFLFKEIYKK